jgi:tight adherence protein B
MGLLALSFMIFLVTLGLSLSGLYLLIVAPAERKKMRMRLAAIEQTAPGPADEEMGLLRQEILSQIPAFNRIFLQVRVMKKLHIYIQQSAVEITAGMVLLISLSLATFVTFIGLLAAVPTVLLLIFVAAAATLPFIYIAFRRARRFAKFEELFPDAIDLLARAVRAGHAFTTGLELIAREMPEPVASEFRITYEQQNFGLPLRDALQNLATRMPSSDVNFFVSALQIQRESGGNLAEILDNLSYVVRERFKILRQVKVHTAQGRMTLYLLTALPPAAAVLMYLSNPKYISILFTDPLGHRAVAGAIVLQVLGYLVIRKIIRIKV